MSNLYPLLVPMASLLTAIISVLPNPNPEKQNFKIGLWIMLAGFASSLLLLWQMIQGAEPIDIVAFKLNWEILPQVKFSVDRLAAVMMVLISGLGALIYHYSSRYLQQDSGQSRHQCFLTLKLSCQLLMILSTDLIIFFITWQLVNWFLCLLSHNYGHKATAQSSFRTFIMLRFGDLAFLAGIVIAYHIFGTVQFQELFARAALDQTNFSFFGTGLEISAATTVTLLIFLAAMSKSAQFPLHMWLTDSLYGPTPVSALLHAGGINVGGILLTRLAPLYILSSTTLHIVLIVGLITAILGTCMMLVQNDIKKTLGYSTMGQMGYMIMECGLGAFSLAVFHLIAHGLFKVNLFLNCGKGIQEARNHPAQVKANSSTQAHTITEWLEAFALSFLMPLVIVIGIHYFLGISFSEHQGLLILLLFSWITASQAILTQFKLRTTLLTKTTMLVIVGIIATAYFFAAERFTHFLNPNPATIANYFEAAKLPNSLFLIFVTIITLSISTVWFFYLNNKNKDPSKSCLGNLKLNLYLFFINRLYLDGLCQNIGASLKSITKKNNQSILVFIIFWALSLIIALRENELLASIGVIAIAVAIWGSIKALTQIHVYRLIFYGGLSQYSILLWHFAQNGEMSPELISGLWSITIIWSGLLLGWNRIQVRYGNLTLNQISGLFQTMPRFSLCMGLLIMAAIGLPPFSLFFSYLEILLSPSTGISYALLSIILIWFITCWYLFKLIQRLLFGPPCENLYHEDLGLTEITIFIFVIALVLIPNSITQSWLMEVIK